ncbi:hypothetical protein [Natrinema sp. SYSU A 869]|nr:hypothetical protein [Natrinema sp. SYSU A 869]
MSPRERAPHLVTPFGTMRRSATPNRNSEATTVIETDEIEHDDE